MPNINPTKQTILLANALRARGIELETEHWDKHKHVDIFIPKERIYIEVDGSHHYTDVKTIISDFNRDFFSFRENFLTKHITNEAIDNHLEEIADAIAEIIKNAPNKIGNNLKS
mgnify:FL=1